MKNFVLIFALFCACFVLVSCSGKQQPASVLLSRAIQAAQAAKWDDAAKLVEQAREQNPENTEIILFSALVLEKQGRSTEALSRLQNIAAANMNDFRIQYTLGRLLFLKAKYDQCLVPLQNALTVRPDDVNALLLLAKAEARLNLKSAGKLYMQLRKRPEFNNNPLINNEIAVLLAIRGKPESALLVFRDSCKDFPLATLNGAVVLDYHLNNKQEAAEWYNRFLRESAGRQELENQRFQVTRRLQEIR